MKLKELTEIMSQADLIRILEEDNTELFAGYIGNIRSCKNIEEVAEREVKKFHLMIDTNHRQYIEKGLMPPMHQEFIPQYEGKDLRMTIYRQIILEKSVKKELV
ncbi:hypothetical protein [Bacteroides sp.]|uniref:hypothetical protein n=1 Tax=Bacteroides sp. TaxID=29523 RepID=UPI002609DCB4|nr:hypothetical protein [Bacteroides sp.]MDD3040534.1 hypothetical protein [Bacteroides sp.]